MVTKRVSVVLYSFLNDKQWKTKREYLEKATQLFKHYGIRSITMDEIAAQLGISKKTIYQFFTDKDAMVEAVVNEEMKQNEQNAGNSA